MIARLMSRLAALSVALVVAGAALACPTPSLNLPVDLPRSGASGQALTVEWNDPWPAARTCAGGTWLVLAMPERVRLSGEGFFALAPGERAPFGIDFAADRLRAVIPLHLAGTGQLDILPYLIGPFALDWALVHVPIASGSPGQPEIHTAPGRTLDIRPGRPEIVVQDPFDTSIPDEVILSNSGDFLLEIFPGHYRVRDAGTGALLLAAEGLRPGFSPTGRFLTAFGGDLVADDRAEDADLTLLSDLIVHDLFAGQEVLSLRRNGWSGRGDFVAGLRWSPGDGFLAVLYEAQGMIGFQPMLVDDRRFWRDEYGCGACSVQQDGIAVIDAENATVTLGWMHSQDTLSLIQSPPVVSSLYEREEPLVQTGLLLARPVQIPGEGAPIFDLLGPARASLDQRWDDTGVEVVTHQRLDGSAVAASGAEAGAIRRGAGALEDSVQPNRDGRLVQRLAAMGLDLAAAPPLLARTIPSESAIFVDTVLVPFWDSGQEGEEPPEPADWLLPGGYYFDSGRLALEAGLTDAAGAESLTRLGIEVIGTMEHCQVSRALEAHVWTLRRDGGVEQLLHYSCRVGTGYEPEGVLALLRLSPAGAEWVLLAAAPDYAMFEGEEVEGQDPFAPMGPVPVAVHQPLKLQRLDENRLALAGVDGKISIVDLATRRVEVEFAAVPDPAQIETMALTLDGGHLVQLNADGRFHVHDPASGDIVLSGLLVDDEIVIFDRDLNFEATPEGAGYVRLRFPGDRHLYGLDQLGAVYRADGVVQAALAGKPLPSPPDPALPPRLEVTGIDGRTLRATLTTEATGAEVALFRDGVEVARKRSPGPSSEISFALPALPETRWFALRATEAKGLTSRAELVPWQGVGQPKGRLFVLAVGTDLYDDPRISQLRFAVSDARAFASALSADSGLYGRVVAEVIADPVDLATALPQRISAIAARMAPEDTLMLHIAGHGFTDPTGALWLAGRGTRLADLSGTALPFQTVTTALGRVPGRVIVFLDACHSGAAGAGTNDDAVASLLAQDRPVAVLAASKGRQQSLEAAGLGGGAFTAAVVRALQDPATDADGNGAVELTELYAAVKRDVVLVTGGEQTPWIARSGFVGEVPLH